MSQQQDSELVAVQKKSYVTYSMPLSSPNAPTITTLEGRTLLAASGVTGFRTWEAALHLASFLCSPQGRNLIEGKNTLELGAGTGLLAMLCIKHLGSKYVLATDGSDEVIDDLTSNLYLNELDDDPQIDVAVLKWGHALIDGILDNHSGEAVNYDLILGADVVSFYYIHVVSCLTVLIGDVLDIR